MANIFEIPDGVFDPTTHAGYVAAAIREAKSRCVPIGIESLTLDEMHDGSYRLHLGNAAELQCAIHLIPRNENAARRLHAMCEALESTDRNDSINSRLTEAGRMLAEMNFPSEPE